MNGLEDVGTYGIGAELTSAVSAAWLRLQPAARFALGMRKLEDVTSNWRRVCHQ